MSLCEMLFVFMQSLSLDIPYYLSSADLSAVNNICSHAGEQLLCCVVFLDHSAYHEGEFGHAGSSNT